MNDFFIALADPEMHQMLGGALRILGLVALALVIGALWRLFGLLGVLRGIAQDIAGVSNAVSQIILRPLHAALEMFQRLRGMLENADDDDEEEEAPPKKRGREKG